MYRFLLIFKKMQCPDSDKVRYFVLIVFYRYRLFAFPETSRISFQ